MSTSADHDQPSSFHAALQAVLVREIPGCTGLSSVEQLSGGASQETYRLVLHDGTLLALRRAPDGQLSDVRAEHPGLRVEAELLRLAATADIPVPAIRYVFTPADQMGDGIVMEWLDGETLGSRIVRSPDLAKVRPKLAFECGQILARIHGIDLQEIDLDLLSPTELIHLSWDRYQQFETPQPMIDFTARWLLDHLPPSHAPKLVHNDFRNGNLMIGPGGVRAVLDWELAHIGDPMRDLGWLCTNSWRFGKPELPVGGFGRREDLFAGYTSVTGRPVDAEHVKFWEVFGSFWWAVHTLAMVAPDRPEVQLSVERPAIARRSSECQVDCANLIIPGPVDLATPTEFPDHAPLEEMPSLSDILRSVRQFLHEDVMKATDGRTSFMARVAGNSLDIVLRDLNQGPLIREQEQQELRALLGPASLLDSPPTSLELASLMDLRWKLTNGLRDQSIDLEMYGLASHLRTTVVNQLAIDQPRYSGLAKALAFRSQ